MADTRRGEMCLKCTANMIVLKNGAREWIDFSEWEMRRDEGAAGIPCGCGEDGVIVPVTYVRRLDGAGKIEAEA